METRGRRAGWAGAIALAAGMFLRRSRLRAREARERRCGLCDEQSMKVFGAM